MLDAAGIVHQTKALCEAAKQSFCNASPFRLKDLTSRAKQQKLKTDSLAYLDGFSPNVQEIMKKFKFHVQIDTMVDADILGAVIEKFVSPTVNTSSHLPCCNGKSIFRKHDINSIITELSTAKARANPRKN